MPTLKCKEGLIPLERCSECNYLVERSKIIHVNNDPGICCWCMKIYFGKKANRVVGLRERGKAWGN